MLAQVVLTPTESKKLISKAVARFGPIKEAAEHGIVAMHPSSSTYFVVEELTGKLPGTNYWVCGSVSPKGMCVEMAMVLGSYIPKHPGSSPGDAVAWWVVEQGRLSAQEKLSGILDRMKETDVFIKGVNALDPQGNVGILIGDPMQGGTWGVILAASRKKKFTMVYPVGLEKFVPTPVQQAAREAKQAKYEYAMGLPAGLFPCPSEGSITITEVRAIEILSGATAIPVAAGGLGGAEGAITLVIKGEKDQVNKAIGFVEQSKGAVLPQLRLTNCRDCPVPDCRFSVGDKPWVSS